QADRIGRQQFFQNGGTLVNVIGLELTSDPKLELAPIHFDFPFVAIEGNVVAEPMRHFKTTGIAQARPFLSVWLFRRENLHRPAVIKSKGPLHDVKVVSTPVANIAAAVFLILAPLRKTLMHSSRAENRVVGPH